jgi:hypothetical protein
MQTEPKPYLEFFKKISFPIFASVIKLFSTPRLAWLHIKSLGLISDSSLNLNFFFFVFLVFYFYYFLKHFRTSLNVENNLVVKDEPKFKLGSNFRLELKFFIFYFLVFFVFLFL